MSAVLLTHPTRSGRPARVRQRHVGAEAEAQIALALTLARAAGTAYVTKRPTPVRVTRITARGRVEGFFEASPGVDYAGVLAGGRAVFFEAKSCARGVFPLASIEPAQWAEMDALAPFGAVRALVVRWTPTTQHGQALLGRPLAWVVVPWAELAAAHARGDASLAAEHLALRAAPATCTFLDHLADCARGNPSGWR